MDPPTVVHIAWNLDAVNLFGPTFMHIAWILDAVMSN